MKTKAEKNIVKTEKMVNVLNQIYKSVTNGAGTVVPPASELAENYLRKNTSPMLAAKEMQKNQIAKCTTSGFLTGFGGVVTLPITIPVNLGSVLFVQMRMIAATAYIGGYDIHDDQVQTLIYACLAGVSVNELVKKFGVHFANKMALKGVEKIPGKVLTKINRFIGFRFITKLGEKGLVNLGKLIPVVGAVVNGSLDLVETKIIAKRATKMFIENNFSNNIVDVDYEIVEESEETI